MSLIAWWPLTGHTNNHGTMANRLEVFSSGATYATGKIGQAMYKGTIGLTGDQWKSFIGNTISIAMWVYTKDDGTFNAGVPFFGEGGMEKPDNRKFSMFHYPEKTTFHCSWQHDDQSGSDPSKQTYWVCTHANFFEINKWVHLCVVQDAATETITVYKNGIEYNREQVSGLAQFNIKSAKTAPIRANIDYQLTNDIRIYDHALSAKEVKELSKPLVMHYKFNEPSSIQDSTFIVDSSGLGNDGELILPEYYGYNTEGSCARGVNCINSIGNPQAYIKTKLNPSFISDGTVSFWYKKNDNAFIKQNGGFLVATPDQEKQGQYFFAHQPGREPWHDSSVSHKHYYIDGVLNAPCITDKDWHFYCIVGANLTNWESFTMHRHGDDSWLYQGFLADFRVYNSSLSEDDMMELYKTGLSCNKQSQVFSGGLREGLSVYQSTKSNVVNCYEINESGQVPSGYIPLKYIRSSGESGGPAINTNHYATKDTRTVFDYEYLAASASWKGLFGSDNNGINQAMGYGIFLDQSTYSCYVSDYGTYGLWNQRRGTWEQNKRTLIDFTNYKLTVNNTSYDLSTATFAESQVPIYLCAYGRPGSIIGHSLINLYGCQIWEGSQLVRNFIPCINPLNVVGMYDMVNDQFYGSATNSVFLAGPRAIGIERNGSFCVSEFNEI